ncbi:hypothetical protein [Pseudomonas indica]|uniref:hypothetical protein n=1 Tax=Pseudomonas indica TaxID=137658 RepID=UPI003FD0E617
MAKSETALYFTNIIAIGPEQALLAGHLYLEGAEPSVTRVMMIDQDDWFHVYDIPEVVYSALQRAPLRGQQKGNYCFLGRAGLLREHPSGQSSTDTTLDIDNVYLMDLCEVDGELYACGTQNQVLRQSKGIWQRIDQGLYIPLEDEVTACLNGIDGFSRDDVYAVGDGGAIWHWDGKGWLASVAPTNLPLYCVHCAADGTVYIGGAGGILLRGSAQTGWTDIGDRDLCAEVLENMVEFAGKLYVTATDQLLEYDGMQLRETKVPLKGKKAYYAIDAKPDVLWVAGDECVLSFDGRTWQRHICPEN